MAIAGSGGWIPAVRVSIYNRRLVLSKPFHNVPPEKVWMPEEAAALFADYPNAFIYVPTSDNGGVFYLHELLVEMDLINQQRKEQTMSETITVQWFDMDSQETIYIMEMTAIPRIGETVLFQKKPYRIRDVWWYINRKRDEPLEQVVISVESI